MNNGQYSVLSKHLYNFAFFFISYNAQYILHQSTEEVYETLC